MFTGVLFQQSPSEAGDGGLLTGCWVFLWAVLILFWVFSSVCLLLYLFLVVWYFLIFVDILGVL